jgi:hypothetical protein
MLAKVIIPLWRGIHEEYYRTRVYLHFNKIANDKAMRIIRRFIIQRLVLEKAQLALPPDIQTTEIPPDALHRERPGRSKISAHQAQQPYGWQGLCLCVHRKGHHLPHEPGYLLEIRLPPRYVGLHSFQKGR